MNILDKIEQVLYDIAGIIVPGIIILMLLLPMALVYYKTGHLHSPMYIILELDKGNFKFIGDVLSKNLGGYQFLFLIIIAFIVGHSIIPLSSFIYGLLDKKLKNLKLYDTDEELKEECTGFLMLVCSKNEFAKYKKEFTVLENKCMQILQDVFGQVKNFNTMKDKKKFLYSYARSVIKMKDIKTLTFKYIAKYNLYKSLSVIWLIVSIDSIISSIIICTKLFSIFKILISVFIILFNYLCFRAFRYEYHRHLGLSDKESLYGMFHYYDQENRPKV